MKFFLFTTLLLAVCSFGQSLGVHPVSNDYQRPTDPLVLQKLEKWQGPVPK